MVSLCPHSLMPRNTPLYFPFRADQGESEEEDFFVFLQKIETEEVHMPGAMGTFSHNSGT